MFVSFKKKFAAQAERTLSKGLLDFPTSPGSRLAKKALYVVTLCLVVGCQESPGSDPHQSSEPTTHDVTLYRIQNKMRHRVFAVPGSVVPAQRLQVTSRISGFIDRIHVDEGDLVEVGGALIDIDDRQLEAGIRASEASLESAKADLADAEADVERFQSLARKQVLSEDELRDARVRRALASAQVEKMRAELEAHQEDRRYARVISPVRGQVRERLRDPGDLITAGDPVLYLDVLGAMEFEVFVPLSSLEAAAGGKPVEIMFDHRDESVEGTVIGAVYSADPVTRRYKVRIALPDNAGIAPGQFGSALLKIGNEPVTILQQTAVVSRAGIAGVFVVDENNTVRFRSVRLGRRWGAEREVLAGLEPNTKVVMTPSPGLRDGDLVRQVAGRGP
jgi:RND family efflux transporter MFP subunit